MGGNMAPCWNFNPRPRTGGDNGFPAMITMLLGISTHAPAQGATFLLLSVLLTIIDFNPRPRTGGDFPLYPSCKSISRISTHAPAQGATLKSSTTAEFAQISTHAPAQGATGAVKH